MDKPLKIGDKVRIKKSHLDKCGLCKNQGYNNKMVFTITRHGVWGTQLDNGSIFSREEHLERIETTLF